MDLVKILCLYPHKVFERNRAVFEGKTAFEWHMVQMHFSGLLDSIMKLKGFYDILFVPPIPQQNQISVDQPYAGPDASCCGIIGIIGDVHRVYFRGEGNHTNPTPHCTPPPTPTPTPTPNFQNKGRAGGSRY
jgi:hypothetical protein